MNCNVSTTWFLKDIPTAETMWNAGDEGEGFPRIHLAKSVDAFQITLPVLLLSTTPMLSRFFPGGTMLALLQFIYTVYQEAIPLEEFVQLQEGVFGTSANRLAGLRARLEAGQVVRRLDVIGRTCSFEGIRDNVLLLD